jgi:hypothetical protein
MKVVQIQVQAPQGVASGGVLMAGEKTQVAAVCEYPVVGVTHKKSSERSED